jgi:hypothetical protein
VPRVWNRNRREGAHLFPWRRIGSEFMPPLYEGSVLFMPISVPGLSIEEAKRPREKACDFWEQYFLRTMLGARAATAP